MGSKRKHISREARIQMMDEEILDVAGAAELLGVSKKAVYGLLKKGDMPARKVGKEWRFSRKNLINWVANAENLDTGNTAGNITDILKNSPNVRLVK